MESSAHSPEDGIVQQDDGLMKFHKTFCNNKGGVKERISNALKRYVSYRFVKIKIISSFEVACPCRLYDCKLALIVYYHL